MEGLGRAGFLADLKYLLEEVKAKPTLLDQPDLEFFKVFLNTWQAPKRRGGSQPAAAAPEPMSDRPSTTITGLSSRPTTQEGHVSDTESEPDLDAECVPADPDPGPTDIDLDACPAVDAVAKLGANKMAAAEALARGEYTSAAHLYGECLKAVPSALMFAKRAECYIHQKMPMAAIRDCDAAVRLNPDSGKGYKIRGWARRTLGQWDEALKDLGTGLAIDFDEEMFNLQKVVQGKIQDRKDRRNRRRLEKRREKDKLREAEREAARREIDEQQRKKREEEEAVRRKNAQAKSSPIPIPPHLVKTIADDADLRRVLYNPRLMKVLAEICAYTFPPGS